MFLSIKNAVFILGVLAICLWILVCLIYLGVIRRERLTQISLVLFPNISSYGLVLFSLFIRLRLLNLFSLMLYSYPITTTLRFNLGAAFSCWVGGVLLQRVKYKSVSSLLPVNSPWYLVPFLCLVEIISILVRPITLCFRLLANITAGHVLISLICKMPVLWAVGRLFGVLELIVALVQRFVFSMLIRVYLDEAFRH